MGAPLRPVEPGDDGCPAQLSQRYIDALGWSAQLHRGQQRKGKGVPYLSHLLAVSALVWQDGGSENEAIAALLHDAIEDVGLSAGVIAGRFGKEVAAIVADCTDTSGPVELGADKEPWLVRKTRFLGALEGMGESALRVIAADKAHNARDLVLDERWDRRSWERFSGGLEGSLWFLVRVHQALSHRLPQSRSTALLGEAVQELLGCQAFQRLVPRGIAPAVWAASYLDRQDPAREEDAHAAAPLPAEPRPGAGA